MASVAAYPTAGPGSTRWSTTSTATAAFWRSPRRAPAGVGYAPPEGTYLAWLDCRALDIGELTQLLQEEAGVAVVDGARRGPPGVGFLRLNFATTRPVLIQVVSQLARAVANR